MTTALERAIVREATCVEDINSFLESNDLEEIDDVEDLTDLLSKLAEISKEFRHSHAELKCYLGKEKYENDYKDYKAYSDSMKKFTKEAKEKIKGLKKEVTVMVDSRKYVSEEGYLCDKLDRMVSKLNPDEVGLVAELEKAIVALESQLEDYFKIQSNLKTILGDKYDEHYYEKAQKVQRLVEEKIHECNVRIESIIEDEEVIEEKRLFEENRLAEEEKKKMEEKLKSEEENNFLVAEEVSQEIQLRREQLRSKFVVLPSALGDHQLFQLSKDLHDFDLEFNNILAKVTDFSKFVTCDKSKMLWDQLIKMRKDLLTEKNEYFKKVQNEILSRDVSEEKLRNASSHKFDIPKFKGYESELDVFTFKDKFQKLIQPYLQKKLWVETLKLNYLCDPALTLVKTLEDIEEIWKKLEGSFGDSRLLLQNKLSYLKKFDGLCKTRGDEKIILAVSKLRNCMIDLEIIAKTHGLLNELYYGGALEKILSILGEDRERKYLKQTVGKGLNREKEWKILIEFLETEMEFREKFVLNQKSRSTLNEVVSKETSKKSDSYVVEMGREEGVCHLCGSKDHHSYISPYSKRRCVSYFACKSFVDMSPKERLKMLVDKGLCVQCLTPGAKADHGGNCNSTFCCKDKSHKSKDGKRVTFEDSPEISKGYHVLVCDDHKDKDENKRLLEKFKEKVLARYAKDLPEFSQKIRISNFADTSVNLANPNSNEDRPERAIYMLQTIEVEGEKFNVFYDNGCGDMIVKYSAMEKLAAMGRANQEIPGPLILSGVGDNKSVIKHGIYKIKLPLFNGTEAEISGPCLDVVTAEFPKHSLVAAKNDVYKECVKIRGKEAARKLPKLPSSVGGTVDIMIGIMYNKYLPREVIRLDNGLSLSESVFRSPDGSRGVLGGPHTSFSRAFTTSHQSMCFNNFLSPEAVSLRNFSWLSSQTPLLTAKEFDTVSESHVAKKSPPENKLFEKLDQAGTVVDYRCKDCRGCMECKKSDRLESVSIQEELEQNVIENCVKVDIEKGKTTAKLPFLSNPISKLKNNKELALKIYKSQVRKLLSNPKDMEAVLKSEKVLHDLGFVSFLDDLDPSVKQAILDSPVKNFIPWRVVWNLNSVTTFCRLVFDATIAMIGSYGLNDLLAKGTNNMNKLVELLIRWSIKRFAFHTDIQKMYNAVQLDQSHWCYQLYLWSDEFDLENPKVKVIKTLIYGVKPSGNLAECALRKTAKLFEETYERVSEVVHKEIYVDDCIAGEQNEEDRRKVTDELKIVLNRGGFNLKGVTFSNSDPPEHLSEDGKSIKVGGMKWYPKRDILKLNVGELNFAHKRRGRKSLDSVGKIPDEFTRRDCLAKVSEIFDPLGKCTPLISGMKIDLHDLVLRKLDWGDPVPSDLKEVWFQNFKTIQELREIEFHRTIVPENAANLEIETIDTGDASNKMTCAAIYARFLLKDGSYSCQLVFSRSKIVPDDVSLPRAELLAALLNANIGHVVQKSFDKFFSRSLKITDSQVVLHWIHCMKSQLKLFVRNRVIEINRLSDANTWRYVRSSDNISDLGTRKGATVGDIIEESEWHKGKPWMTLNESMFPVQSVHELKLSASEQKEISEESALNFEVNFDYHPNRVVPAEVKSRYEFSNYVINPNYYGFRKAVRILSLVYRFIRKFCEKHSNGCRFQLHSKVENAELPTSLSCNEGKYLVTSGIRKGSLYCPGGKVVVLSEEDLKYALTYFFRKATLEIKQFVDPKYYINISSDIEGILYYDSRILPSADVNEFKELSDVMLDLSTTSFVVPLTDALSPIAFSIVREVHWHHKDVRHKGVETVLRYAQMISHIINGRELVKSFSNDCVKCRINRKKSVQVKMGPLPEEHLKIAPAFYRSQTDLFGPYNAYSNLNKRKTVKLWIVIFCCTSTSAVDLKVMEDYSTEAFLLAFIRFSCRVGYPKFLLPDEGSQLVKGCNSMELSFTDLKHRLHSEFGTQFETCPVGCHYMHGKVERKIQDVKKSMNECLSGKRLSMIQWETLAQEIANGINNLPLGLGNKTQDLENLDILTPNRLLLGRNNDRCPAGPLVVTDNFRHIINSISDIYLTWFRCWLISYVPTLIARPKWHTNKGEISVGDIVLFLKSEKEFEKNYQYGIIKKVLPSSDGLIRKVEVEYQNSTENVKRVTKRGIRELVVVHPIDEIGIDRELAEISE